MIITVFYFGPTNRTLFPDDPRFAQIHTNPKFALPKKKDSKVVIDKRFKGMLKDDDFTTKAKVDRYGRKIEAKEGAEEIKRYYRLEDEDEDEDATTSESEEEQEKYDPARGGGFESSSDEEDSDEEVDEEEAALLKEQLEEADEIPTGDPTRRFAAVNLDWDNVRAADLYKAFDSFKPANGKIIRVTIYPSEFGKERLAREELEGPILEKDESEDEDSDKEVTSRTIVKEDTGEEYDSSKLRKYQLERLRYYYAVVECDSIATAQHIYDNCDGCEYESSANFFDLQFIPDDMEFDEQPHDECDSPPLNYKPAEFVTDALQNSKVKLTWDADDQKRLTVARKAFSQKEIEENDLKAYLASSSDESEDEDKEAARQRLRALLGLPEGGEAAGKDDEDEGGLEITFTPGLSNNVNKEEEKTEEEETTIEKYKRKEREKKKARKEAYLAKRGELNGEKGAEEEKEDLGFDDPFFDDPTPAAKKKAEKKAEKAKKRAEKQAEAEAKAKEKEELELVMMSDEDNVLNGKKMQHFDIKQVVKAEKSKGKKKNKKAQRAAELAEGKQEGFTMDVNDPRFSAVFKEHEFAIDPSNPRFMKTEGMKKLLEEKRKRRRDNDEEAEEGKKMPKKNKKDNESNGVSSLVERIRKKAGKA